MTRNLLALLVLTVTSIPAVQSFTPSTTTRPIALSSSTTCLFSTAVRHRPDRNFYAMLGLSWRADYSEIEDAYTRFAKRYSPKNNPGKDMTEKFEQINLAYEILDNPDWKQKYDMFGEEALSALMAFRNSRFSDFYAVLGLSRKATQREIIEAYDLMSKQYHPISNQDDAAVKKFKDINIALEVLTNPGLKRQYDRHGAHGIDKFMKRKKLISDYFAILGLHRLTATDENVRYAYRRLAKLYHPDLNPDRDTTKRFQDINQAYQALGAPEKKRNFNKSPSVTDITRKIIWKNLLEAQSSAGRKKEEFRDVIMGTIGLLKGSAVEDPKTVMASSPANTTETAQGYNDYVANYNYNYKNGGFEEASPMAFGVQVGAEADLSEIFSSFFGGGMGGRGARTRTQVQENLGLSSAVSCHSAAPAGWINRQYYNVEKRRYGDSHRQQRQTRRSTSYYHHLQTNNARMQRP